MRSEEDEENGEEEEWVNCEGGQGRGNYERRDFVAVGGWSVGSHGRTASGPSGFRAMVYSGIRVLGH